MLEHLRSAWTRVIMPVARLLLACRITPDMVTWAGTIATVVVALVCFSSGWLWQGVAILLVFILSDSLDGTMARLSGRASRWGAFLDSTLDRIADGAVLGGLTLYLAWSDYPPIWAGFGMAALVCAEVTSYAKARGESLGLRVAGGLAGRADRLVIALAAALVEGLGVDWVLPGAMGLLSVLGVVTIIQRMLIVRRALAENTQ